MVWRWVCGNGGVRAVSAKVLHVFTGARRPVLGSTSCAKAAWQRDVSVKVLGNCRGSVVAASFFTTLQVQVTDVYASSAEADATIDSAAPFGPCVNVAQAVSGDDTTAGPAERNNARSTVEQSMLA